MDDVESHLQSEDHGRDLTSVQNLLMKHERLEADIAAHQTEIDQAQEVAQSLVNADHFMSDQILERVKALVKRWVGYMIFVIFNDTIQPSQLVNLIIVTF